MIEQYRATGGRSVTARVAAILHAVAARPDRSLTEVARSAELPLSTTHRLLTDMVATHLLQRGPGGRYRIGPADGLAPALKDLPAAAVGAPTAAVGFGAVRTHIADALDDLASISGLRARFGVWHERGVSVLERPGGRGRWPSVSGLRVLPVHATAIGRAMLAHAPSDEVLRVLGHRLPAYTDDTVTEPKVLAAAVAAVSANGVAVVRQEWRGDESAVAVPVFGPNGVVAALELVGGPSAFAAAPEGGTLPLTAAAPALVVGARALGRRLAEYPTVLPSGRVPAPLRWPVDPTAPTWPMSDTITSTA